MFGLELRRKDNAVLLYRDVDSVLAKYNITRHDAGDLIKRQTIAHSLQKI